MTSLTDVKSTLPVLDFLLIFARSMKQILLLAVLSLLGWISVDAQQVADTLYKPTIPHPTYSKGKGPVVMIDQAHNNYHTRTGRYLPFARLLERDGYVVKDYDGRFRKSELDLCKVLVVSNALNSMNVENWFLPTPTAFGLTEMEDLREWVKAGGSLFLIADHMPFAGAAMDFAAMLGFQFTNGIVMDTTTPNPSYFNTSDSSLVESIVTTGRNETEHVHHVATFTGQGFRAPAAATPVLVFDERYINFLTDTAWVFTPKTPHINMNGWLQGAIMPYGKGRLAVFGEAAMFSAQLAGPQRKKIGMNADDATENYKLLLNIMHWLDGTLQ